MNKMKVISILWGLFLLSMIFILTAASKKYLKKIEPYERLENVLVSTTKKYVEENLDLEKGKTIIKTEELFDKDYLKEFKVDNDNCEGYVVINYENEKEYNGYVKCSEYKTKGYEKNLN
ncbi:MAG: hypothetical protein IJ574_06170 [Bacilli bacterium]|nr:hypothetical protein [Bacilli bacterium]